jgi:Kef-type K+ transport system membrane component KefB
MRKVLLYTMLLIGGLALSQVYPILLGDVSEAAHAYIKMASMFCLAFIMIHVGFECHLNKSKLGEYGKDYLVAMTAAAFPWILVALYFVFILAPPTAWFTAEIWQESLLGARFAAPTSAGVLFSMLAAAGLASTWVFRKARILAIFDDIDTVLLLIPLQMMIIGIKLELMFVVAFMLLIIWLAYQFNNSITIPSAWYWLIVYALLITAFSETVYFITQEVAHITPLHLEVLLPAFALGSMMRQPHHEDETNAEHKEELEEKHEEHIAHKIIAGAFMVLVGLSMPIFININVVGEGLPAWYIVAFHILMITIISNIGKMFVAFFYRSEAHWKERVAVAVAMFPRGEVGAGVLLISLSYGISQLAFTVAMLSLVLNLVLTGFFIWIVQRLIKSAEKHDQDTPPSVAG